MKTPGIRLKTGAKSNHFLPLFPAKPSLLYFPSLFFPAQHPKPFPFISFSLFHCCFCLPSCLVVQLINFVTTVVIFFVFCFCFQTLRARVVAKAEEKKLELLFLQCILSLYYSNFIFYQYFVNNENFKLAVSGTICAATLARNVILVTLFDSARAPGGRMSQRRFYFQSLKSKWSNKKSVPLSC
ncbi:uncharacterized protein LOC120211617 [Hibiscus syriacus]|uniref:uncharacterized protein LOC120211617 n=1 Tax=Hibiscus syriacus TaxID=106335 RepID=UPI001920D250|nr:uncharacterized protein LOC120211617 [Hibiscus syriacus]